MKKGGESISAEGTQGKVSSKKTSSKEISKIPLEETIRKVLHGELRLIFRFSPTFFSRFRSHCVQTDSGGEDSISK